MLKKRIILVLASLSLSALVSCSSGGGGDKDLDIAEIQEIEQTGEFSEDEFFASEDVDNLGEEQLLEEVPGLDEDLEVGQDELEASGDDDLDSEEEDLFAESGLTEDNFQEEDSIAQNDDIGEDELEGLLAEEVGEDVLEGDLGEDDFASEDLDFGDEDIGEEGQQLGLESEEDLGEEDLDFGDEDIASEDLDFGEEGQQLALESEGDLFRDLEEEPETETFSEPSQNYQDDSSEDLVTEDIGLAEDISVADVDYSQVNADNNDLVATGPTASKSFIPVKKMKMVPYDKNGVLVNAVYFVRQGDTLRSIADKVYGAGSAVDFRIVNPHLNEGNLRVGQKVYYNSPSRSQERSRFLTYYEDAKVPVMNYSAREGENIREISQMLLGHSRSWMEIWASNLQVDSKGILEAPYEIRYWEGAPSGSSAPVLADAQSESNQVTNQANLDVSEDVSESDIGMDGSESGFEEQEFVQDVASDEPTFDSESLEESIAEELTGDLAAVESVGEQQSPSNVGDDVFDDTQAENQGFDGEIANNPTDAEANPRNVALNNAGDGFSAQNQGGMAALMNDPGQTGVIAVALVLLLAVGFIVIRRRRANAEEAIEMESFDFGGETVIEDEIGKTQVDI